MILTNSTDITVSPLHALSSNDKDWEQWAVKSIYFKKSKQSVEKIH